MFFAIKRYFSENVILALAVVAASLFAASAPKAQVTAFKQAVAEAVAADRDLAVFYQTNGYQSFWTGNTDEERRRRQALFRALDTTDMHGLPGARYDVDGLMARMKAVRSPRDRGFVEAELSKTFVRLSQDMQTGALIPSQIDRGIKREVALRDRGSYLTALSTGDPGSFFRKLPPQNREYARLMKEKLRLEALEAQGGWGQVVPAKSLKPGATGSDVVALRNRLISMGYMRPSSGRSYDADIKVAVYRFQQDHGLETDGVAGSGTMNEINQQVQARLQSVVVAMERERWLNQPRGDRHILVNLTDFSARIVDHDRVTFQTRAVVGKNVSDRRSPEFSDEMEYMVINPTWNVPRSIAVKEYLPQMKRNRYAVGHLQLYDRRGRKVPRGAVNFHAFNARNFPFDIKQPPSRRNALGLVKFMFPNKYNIYLHDTPAKKLFARQKRDFSHGCIRLHQPFEFAYEMLSRQESDPESFFHAKLDTGRETVVRLDKSVPVHITYRTAFTQAKGRTQFRGDVYGRDAKIWEALSKAGVSLAGVQG